jgi:hypothetical protein
LRLRPSFYLPQRHVIVDFSEIPDDLIVAVQRLPEVALYRYKIAMTLEAIKAPVGGCRREEY